MNTLIFVVSFIVYGSTLALYPHVPLRFRRSLVSQVLAGVVWLAAFATEIFRPEAFGWTYEPLHDAILQAVGGLVLTACFKLIVQGEDDEKVDIRLFTKFQRVAAVTLLVFAFIVVLAKKYIFHI